MEKAREGKKPGLLHMSRPDPLPDFSDDEAGCTRSMGLVKDAFAEFLVYVFGDPEDADLNRSLYNIHMNVRSRNGIPHSITFHAALLDEDGNLLAYPELADHIDELLACIDDYGENEDGASILVEGNTVIFGEPFYLIYLLNHLAAGIGAETLDQLRSGEIDLEKPGMDRAFKSAAARGRALKQQLMNAPETADTFLRALPGRAYAGLDDLDFTTLALNPMHAEARIMPFNITEITTAIRQDFGNVRDLPYDPHYNMN